MNAFEHIGEWAGTLFASGWEGRLEYAAVALLVFFAVAVPWHAVAAWWRGGKRSGTDAPPPPARALVEPVGYADGVPCEGDPLNPAEAQMLAVIEQRFKDDGKKRMAAPRRGPAKRAPKSARTGRK